MFRILYYLLFITTLLAQVEKEKLISLSFEEADIRTVLRTFAKLGNVNIVASPRVAGKVTLELKDVSWDVAFNTLLRVYGLTAVEKEKGIIGVITLEESEEQTKLLPLETEIFEIKYGKAENIEKEIKSLLTDRGKTEVDRRKNSIIVTDIPKVLRDVKELIEKIDTPTPQVMIEARIVEIDYRAARELGIEWKTQYAEPTVKTRASAELKTPVADVFKFSFGTLHKGVPIDVILTALEEENKAHILSRPKIVVMDNEEAMILNGKKIPIVTLDMAGNKIIQFYDVALKLTVRPHINPKNQVVMELHPEASDLSGEATVMGGIIILSTEAKTTLLVNEGETAVIGGIVREKEGTFVKGIPFLCKIPLIGYLFRSTSKAKEKVDLMIFVTPHIIPVEKR